MGWRRDAYMREISKISSRPGPRECFNAAERSPRAGERRPWCRRPLATVPRRPPRSCRRRACLHLRGSRDCKTRARGNTFFLVGIEKPPPRPRVASFLLVYLSRVLSARAPKHSRDSASDASSASRSTKLLQIDAQGGGRPRGGLVEKIHCLWRER